MHVGSHTPKAYGGTQKKSVANEALSKGLLSETEAQELNGSSDDQVEIRYSCGSYRSSCGSSRYSCGSYRSSCGSSRYSCGSYRSSCGSSRYSCGSYRSSCGSSRYSCGSTRSYAQRLAGDLKERFYNDFSSNMSQASAGGAFLTQLSSATHGTEKVVVDTAIEAFNDCSLTFGQAAVAGAAISAVASGISGPAGLALAQVGFSALADPIHESAGSIPSLVVTSVNDRGNIGEAFTEAIAEHGDHGQRCGATSIQQTASYQAPLFRMRTYEGYLRSLQ